MSLLSQHSLGVILLPKPSTPAIPWRPSDGDSTVHWTPAYTPEDFNLTAGDKIIDWYSRVGQPIDAWITHGSARRPEYFDGAGEVGFFNRERLRTYTRLGLSANPALTVAAVLNLYDVNSGWLWQLGTDQSSGMVGVELNAQQFGWRGRDSAKLFTPPPTNQLVLVTLTRPENGTMADGSAYLNGSELAVTQPGPNTVSPNNTDSYQGIGRGRDANGEYHLNALLRDYVLLNSDADTDRVILEGYLAHYHGLQSQLPLTHLYYNDPPEIA